MSETLLRYINKEVKLSKKIKTIEKDFKNGYLFAELLSKEGFLISNKLTFFNANAKTKAEIKLNFILLRDDLSKIGIHLDESSIEDLVNNVKGSSSKLLYKIKTQIDRKKIKFDDIMTKIIGYQKEEKKDKEKFNQSKSNYNKTFYQTKSDLSNSNKLPELSYMSTFYGTNNNFNSVTRKQPGEFGLNINTFGNSSKFLENNKFISDRILKDKKYNKYKLESFSQTNSNFMPIIPKTRKNKTKLVKDIMPLKANLIPNKTNKMEEIEEQPDSELNKDSKLYQQQQKKYKSHGKNQQKIKIFSEKYLEYNNKYIKYSCFDRNTFKIGIDLKEIDPKLYKQGIGYKNDYIPNEIVLHRLKKKVIEREEEYKKKMEEKKFMTEEERYLKNSIISQNQKNNGKKFQINFNKNTQLYKMHEYENYRKEAFPFKEKVNPKLLYINKDNIEDRANATKMDRFYTKTILTNFSNEFESKEDNFNEYHFFKELGKESLTQRKLNSEYKQIIRAKNYGKIKNIINLIIDLTDECFYYQHKKKLELIEIPEFKDLVSEFIKGKINLTSSNKNNNSLINLDDENLRNENDEEKNYINNEKYISEYNDYIFLRGEWNEEKYIPKNFYGSQLHVYQVLGEDINNLIASGKMVTQGVKPSQLMKMKNEEFELKESEKDNINLPKENAKNRLFGEIIELNFDNMPNNFSMNKINNNLMMTNLKNNDSKTKLIKRNFLSQEITYNNAIDDTLYTNNKELIKRNNSIVINTSNQKVQSNTNNINIINNDLNISEIGQDPNKSIHNIDESLFNNNIPNNNATNIQNNPYSPQNNDNNFSHIPIKMCLIGHSFSGRKTQGKLLCEKYPKLKYYSLEKLINDYSSEYERLHTPVENNPKMKNIKKNQLEKLESQRLEELKQYEEIFKILEPLIKDNKKYQDFPDEAKINILIQQIKKDFPRKEGDIYEEISKRNLRKQTIEQELEKIKEESEKKKKLGPKEIKEQQLLEKELEDLIKEEYCGFILVDFPNNYNQYIKFENILTGFVQQIDKEENIRDKYLELLTFSVDKPYANISNLCPEVMNYLGYGKNALYKSFFNNYIWLEIDENETLKRVNDRLIDETTNIIYHKEFDPPPQEKKLLERLKPVTEPTEENIKNELKNYDIEFPKILSYISLFHNLKKITKTNKNEILGEIDELLLNAVKKFEDREIKDEIIDLNNFEPEESENIKYYKKLSEVKKRVNKEISGNIISLWTECLNNYSKGIKEFLYNFFSLKKNILDKMNIMQEIFIEYLNNPNQKKKLVELFQKKYEAFIDKYNHLKKKKIVREEFQKDVVELTEHFWEIIQMRKRDAINELKNLKDQNFIEHQSELFWNYLSNLFLVETNFYIKKLNIIRKYYYEFERNKFSEKCPFEYNINEDDILKEINDFILFNKNFEENKKEIIKDKKNSEIKENQTIINNDNKEICPRIDRIFKNCFKFLFYYDKHMYETDKNEKEKFALNSSNISGIQKRRHRKKNITDGKTEPSIFSESKILISYEDEMKAALNNEKIKYKIRISLLKFFGEQFLIEANNISDKTFENLDNSIIMSIDAQNTAMNSLMEKVKKDILEGRKKITYNVELDTFKIYHKLNLPFNEFILQLYNTMDNKDKKIDINDLNKIYLDLKNYEIQDNYVTVDSVKEIIFKKHLFEFKSKAFVKYLIELPYHYLNNLLNKFIYKSSAGQNLVRIDRLFTILSLIDLSPPSISKKKEILENVSNKLKFHCFLSKEDFLNTVLWFEKEEKNSSNIINKMESNSSVNTNMNYYKSSKLNSQKLNLLELSPNKNDIIAEENYNIKENINNNNIMNIDDDNNDNDIILPKDEKNEDINETRIQMDNLFKNLAVTSPSRSPSRMKSKKSPKKMTKFNSSPIKINEEYKLKDFLFDVNKNYDNQINFIDFMNVVSLQFLKNKISKRKSKAED